MDLNKEAKTRIFVIIIIIIYFFFFFWGGGGGAGSWGLVWGWEGAVQLWTLRGLGCCITNYCFNIMGADRKIANSGHKVLHKTIKGVGRGGGGNN